MENNELENINGVNVSNDTDEMSRRLNKIKRTDFSIVIKILFYLMMITSGIRSVINVFSGYAYYRLSQADSQFSLWENSFALSLVNMFGTIINIVGIILILKRKIVGFILLVVVTVFLPIMTECLGIDVASTIILGLIRLAVISLVLLIRNDGVSGWAIITAADKDSDQINPITPSADNVPAIIEEQKDVEEDSDLTTEKVDEIDDKSIAEIVDNQDSITNESDKIPVENQEESHPNEAEISQEVEPTEDNNVEVKPNETKPKKRMKPWLIALIVVLSILVLGWISIFVYVSSKNDYPHYVNSFSRKVYYNYEMQNSHRHARKYLKKAQNAKDNDLIELYEEYVKKAYSNDPHNYDVLMEMSVMYEDSDIIEAQNKVYEIIVNGYAKNDNDLYDAYERCIRLTSKIYNLTENNKLVLYAQKNVRDTSEER